MEVDLHIFASPGRKSAKAEIEIFQSPGRTDVWKAEFHIFASQGRADVWKRSFRPLEILAEQVFRSGRQCKFSMINKLLVYKNIVCTCCLSTVSSWCRMATAILDYSYFCTFSSSSYLNPDFS